MSNKANTGAVIGKSQNKKAEVVLQFVYFKKYLNLENISLNFSGSDKYSIVRKGSGLELLHKPNDKYASSILNIEQFELLSGNATSGKITNVTAIVGQNGSGKSNILELIQRIVTDDLDFEEELLVCLSINGSILCYHSLNEEVECNSEFITPKKNTNGISLISRMHYEQAGKPVPEIQKLVIPELKSSRIVFYTPYADLQSYPSANSHPNYTNISTNYLLQVDRERGEEFVKNDFDQILAHKYQDTLRMIDLVYSGLPYPEEIMQFIPKEIEVLMLQTAGFPKNERDIDPTDKLLFDKFDEQITAQWQQANLKQREKPFEVNYNSIVEHCEASLCYNFLVHYFLNNGEEFNKSSGLSVDDFDWSESVFTNTVRFFEKQKWIDGSKILNLLTTIRGLMDGTGAAEKLHGPSFRVTINSQENAIALTSSYYLYLDLFQGKSHQGGLLNLSARSLSSGEKSLLTLFSRLYSVKNNKLRNPGELESQTKVEDITNLVILLDEGDMGFHPDWQKKYLNYLVEFLPYCFSGYTIQLILTSHSPFILSDLPRENVIFLNKVKGKTSVSEPTSIVKTFGGNIHELFASPFFMQNGLIGEYAKSKIDEVIKEILSENPITAARMKEMKLLIEAIGESVIRVKLMQMLNEKKLKESI